MPSNRTLLLLGGAGILGYVFLRGGGFGGITATGGAGGFGGLGGGAGVDGVPGNIDGLETSQAVDGSQGTPISIPFYVPEPSSVPSPIIPSNTIPSDVYTPTISGGAQIGPLTTPGHRAINQYVFERPTVRPTEAIVQERTSAQTATIFPGRENEGRGIFQPLNIRARSPLARSILTNPDNQAPSTGAYQRFTPVALREVYGIGINPFSRRDPVDQGQNRYPNAPAFVGPTDSAVRAATNPELQSRGIAINPYSNTDSQDNGDNQNIVANNLITRARSQTAQRPATSTPTRQTGSPESRASDTASSEANMGISNTNRVRPTPPAPTPTPEQTAEELIRRGIGINPFGRSGN